MRESDVKAWALFGWPATIVFSLLVVLLVMFLLSD